MSSCTEIRVPQETVNDDFVKIVEWHVEPGAKIASGDLIVSIETSKAVLEIEAEAEGYLEVLKNPGDEVAVGACIGKLHADRGAALAAAATGSDETIASGGDPGKVEATPAGASISKKALALIRRHGIDPMVFAGRGLVREAEVLAYLEEQESPPITAAEPEPAAAVRASSGAAKHAGATRADRPRGLFGDAAVSARDRGTSVISLALNYIFRNWLLGNLVRWAPRGINLFVHRLRGVKMGDGCYIDPTAIVETAYPENVTLGKDVRITAGAIVMTHIKAPHYLRETGIMPPVIKPVVFEDHCFIGVNAVIMPGVTVGRAAVVASGAVAVSSVPPYTMVAGNPAKVVKRFPKPEGED